MRVAAPFALVALVAGCGPGEEPRDRAPSPMAVAAVEAAEGSLLRALTVEGGCEVAAWAEVAESPRAVRLTIVGRSPGSGGCTSEEKERCVEVRLERPLGRRKARLAHPYSPPLSVRAGADRLAAASRGGCRRLPTRR